MQTHFNDTLIHNQILLVDVSYQKLRSVVVLFDIISDGVFVAIMNLTAILVPLNRSGRRESSVNALKLHVVAFFGVGIAAMMREERWI